MEWVKIHIQYEEALDLASRLRSRMTIPAMNGSPALTDPVLKAFVERLEQMISLHRLHPDFKEGNSLGSLSITVD